MSVVDGACLSIRVQPSELQLHRHAYLDVSERNIDDLRGKPAATVHLDNADGDNLGVEFEFDFAANERWLFTGSVGLLDADVESITTFDLDLDDFVVQRDIEQAKAPSWQAFFRAQWLPASDWRLTADIESGDSHRYGHYHAGKAGGSDHQS